MCFKDNERNQRKNGNEAPDVLSDVWMWWDWGWADIGQCWVAESGREVGAGEAVGVRQWLMPDNCLVCGAGPGLGGAGRWWEHTKVSSANTALCSAASGIFTFAEAEDLLWKKLVLYYSNNFKWIKSLMCICKCNNQSQSIKVSWCQMITFHKRNTFCLFSLWLKGRP